MSLTRPSPVHEWKVPVHPVEVELRLLGEESRSARIFLHETTPDRRPQTVLDVLNNEGHFVPVLLDDACQLLSKDLILEVRDGPSLLPRDEGMAEAVESVRVLAADGLELDGQARIVGPPGHRRVQDLLNGPEIFFALFLDEETVLLNKRHIRRILLSSR